MKNFNKNEFEFETKESNLRVIKNVLRFNKTKKDGLYRIAFIKYNTRMIESTGWINLNNYFGMDPNNREIQHMLCEKKIKCKIFSYNIHNIYYTEAQTKEIVEFLESVRIMKLLTE